MHVLTPTVMELLAEQVSSSKPTARIELSPALAKLAGKGALILSLEVQGVRYNIGLRYGLLYAQLALALDGNDREEILTQMVDLLTARERNHPAEREIAFLRASVTLHSSLVSHPHALRINPHHHQRRTCGS